MSQNSIQEYSQGLSELMVETIQPEEPTTDEIIAYAQEVIGMTLPEDQPLLYLAREAITSNVPENYQIYSRPNGQIYYKHVVTQQKLYQHPADIYYKKKYKQEKLKLMSQRKTIQFLQRINQDQQYSESPQFTNRVQDPELELINIESRLKRRLEELREEEQLMYENFEKVESSKHQQRMATLNRREKVDRVDNQIKYEKGRIQKQLKQHLEGLYQLSRKEMIKGLNKLRDLDQRAEQVELERQFLIFKNQFKSKLQDEQLNLQKLKKRLQQWKINVDAKIRREKERTEKETIEKIDDLRQSRIKDQNQKCTAQINLRINKFKQKIENQLKSVISLVLNENQSNQDFLQKIKLKEICQKKISAFRKKQLQTIVRQLQRSKKQQIILIERKKQQQFELLFQKIKNQLEEKEKHKIRQFQKDLKTKEQQFNANKEYVYRNQNGKRNHVYASMNDSKSQARRLHGKFKELNSGIEDCKRSIQKFEVLNNNIQTLRKIIKQDPNKDNNITQILRSVFKEGLEHQKHQQTQLKMELAKLRQKLEQDRIFLYAVKRNINSSPFHTFTERAKVKRLGISQSQQTKRLNAIGQSSVKLKKMYQKDLETFIKNQHLLQQFQQTVKNIIIQNKQIAIPRMNYEELSLRQSKKMNSLIYTQQVAFFGRINAHEKENPETKFLRSIRRYNIQVSHKLNTMRELTLS